MYIFFIALGILANFAFVPFAKPYMLFIALSLFFYYLLQAATFKRAFLIGFFFAISYFGFGSWWLFTIPKNTIATLFFGSAIIFLMALYYALASTLSYFAKEKGFIFLTPLIFTAFEALRHSLWGGVSWLNPSDALDYSFFHGVFATFGSLGVDFFIFLFSFLVAFILLSFKKIKAFFAILILLLGNYSFLLILNNISYTKPLKEKLSVLVMQDNFDNDQKDDIDDVLMRLKKYSQILQNFPQIDFAVFPESSESIDFYLVENEIKNYYALIKYPVFFGGYVKRANKTYRG